MKDSPKNKFENINSNLISTLLEIHFVALYLSTHWPKLTTMMVFVNTLFNGRQAAVP